MFDKLIGAIFGRPAGPALPPGRDPDYMEKMLARMQADLAAASLLEKPGQIERILRSHSALIVDLRNQVREIQRHSPDQRLGS